MVRNFEKVGKCKLAHLELYLGSFYVKDEFKVELKFKLNIKLKFELRRCESFFSRNICCKPYSVLEKALEASIYAERLWDRKIVPL